MKRIIFLLTTVLVLIILIGCGKKGEITSMQFFSADAIWEGAQAIEKDRCLFVFEESSESIVKKSAYGQ